MRRWISCVRPPMRPRTDSRWLRVWVERGSMPYSAVTQPRPELRSQPRDALLDAGGAEHARVAEISAEPSACS